jgi:hypothetical protein
MYILPKAVSYVKEFEKKKWQLLAPPHKLNTNCYKTILFPFQSSKGEFVNSHTLGLERIDGLFGSGWIGVDLRGLNLFLAKTEYKGI